ncbi:MAG: hypothetical protein RLP14_09515 [Owenweeksia sp.]
MSNNDPNREDLNPNSEENTGTDDQNTKEPTGDRSGIKWDEVRPMMYSTGGQAMILIMTAGVIAACAKYLFFCQCTMIS